MIVSAQQLATYLEQMYTDWSALQIARAVEHIQTAGDEVRGALAALYTIPYYTRDANGVVTLPASLTIDPSRTALGPIVKMLAAAFLLDPARGYQPQEDRSAAVDYRMSARAQIKALKSGDAFILPLDKLSTAGITATPALIALITAKRNKSTAGMRQPTEGMSGAYRDPATGEAFALPTEV